jgi:hypothetical protein
VFPVRHRLNLIFYLEERYEARNVETEDVIMCCLVRAVTHLTVDECGIIVKL